MEESLKNKKGYISNGKVKLILFTIIYHYLSVYFNFCCACYSLYLGLHRT